VSAGISEALIVTAFGLGVAIPAVLVFNSLSGRIDRFELVVSSAGGEFADWLEASGRAVESKPAREAPAETDTNGEDEPDHRPRRAGDRAGQGDWA
jgi:biopolymer transport protein ExbB